MIEIQWKSLKCKLVMGYGDYGNEVKLHVNDRGLDVQAKV